MLIVYLHQGSQSVLRAAWDWKLGLAGSIKKWRNFLKLLFNLFEKVDHKAQYFFFSFFLMFEDCIGPSRGPCVWERRSTPIGPFLNVDKNKIFQGFVWTNLSKFWTVYEILNFYLVILTKFLKEIWPFFWPFFIFQDLAFFETTYGQIWPF